MEYYFSWKAEKGIDIYVGDYFATAILVNGDVLPETEGYDEYKVSGLILPAKRVSGFGRARTYSLTNMPAGLGTIEVEPSNAIAIKENSVLALSFQIETNIILDQGLLAQCLCLDVQKPDGPLRQISLSCPDVAIHWQSRGNYIVTASI